MTKQCPSCGGDCGRTAKSGCQYNTPNPKFPDKFEICDASELAERLCLGKGTSPDHKLLLDAAGEIERLTIELAKYKGITDKLLHDLDAAASERDALKADAYALWMLLDDIDTADDMAKNSDAIYRSLCQQYQKKRWAIMSGETIDAIAAIQGAGK